MSAGTQVRTTEAGSPWAVGVETRQDYRVFSAFALISSSASRRAWRVVRPNGVPRPPGQPQSRGCKLENEQRFTKTQGVIRRA
jgi:hypothetical protein